MTYKNYTFITTATLATDLTHCLFTFGKNFKKKNEFFKTNLLFVDETDHRSGYIWSKQIIFYCLLKNRIN